jgi:hypothetical protein
MSFTRCHPKRNGLGSQKIMQHSDTIKLSVFFIRVDISQLLILDRLIIPRCTPINAISLKRNISTCNNVKNFTFCQPCFFSLPIHHVRVTIGSIYTTTFVVYILLLLPQSTREERFPLLSIARLF